MREIEFIHLLRSNFQRHFVYLSFARRPRKECACVSHKIAQFMLKIANKPFA